jgi:alkaline phosphatase D
MLDLRSYRSKQVAQSKLSQVDDPARSITGDRQMQWLKEQLLAPKVQWKIVGI